LNKILYNASSDNVSKLTIGKNKLDLDMLAANLNRN